MTVLPPRRCVVRTSKCELSSNQAWKGKPPFGVISSTLHVDDPHGLLPTVVTRAPPKSGRHHRLAFW